MNDDHCPECGKSLPASGRCRCGWRPAKAGTAEGPDRRCNYDREQGRCRMPAGVWPDFGRFGYCAWHVRMRHLPPAEHTLEEFDRFCASLIEQRVCDVWTHFDAFELYDVVTGRDGRRLEAADRPCPRGWGCSFTGAAPYQQPPPAKLYVTPAMRTPWEPTIDPGTRMVRAGEMLTRFDKWREEHGV